MTTFFSRAAAAVAAVLVTASFFHGIAGLAVPAAGGTEERVAKSIGGAAEARLASRRAALQSADAKLAAAKAPGTLALAHR